MVVKIMRWRPWPPLASRKFSVRLTVKRLEGFDWVGEGAERDDGGLAVEIRWKGPKISLGSFRRTVKRNCTREEIPKKKAVDGQYGAVLVEWDEEFHSVCNFTGYKDNAFHPWEINFTVFTGLNQGAGTNKVPVFGSAAINLAEYLSMASEHDTEVKISLSTCSNSAVERSLLIISLSFLELKAQPEHSDMAPQSSGSPMPPSPLISAAGDSYLAEKDEVSALKASLRRVKIFVSARNPRKGRRDDDSDGGGSKSEGEYRYSCDSDADAEYESEGDWTVRKSFNYGSLAFANHAGALSHSGAGINGGGGGGGDDEDWIYYSNRRRSDAGCSCAEDRGSSIPEETVVVTSKRSILPWRKRKMSFRSPKAKGEPLLKKAYGEEGGDDIDFDRRQLSSDESVSLAFQKVDGDSAATRTSVSDFGDDSFAVGSWERKEIVSRDGKMKIETEVFFASIDQRSERAAGESACTALVAVIADWLHGNASLMPIKSQFDGLIRDGSLEWRNLCEDRVYMERFPDKHFDLETILGAKVRDLRVVPEKSFVGFFHPDGDFEFLQGAMSFDGIWDEISSGEASAAVYIISWNDHFFVLKIDSDAYYIIDTLGERLHEGCTQAYIMKFDGNTVIRRASGKVVAEVEGDGGDDEKGEEEEEAEEEEEEEEEEEVVCRGKETCKEYVKRFLASIPIRELQEDVKKGLAMATPIHHRLQIEFHFTDKVVTEDSGRPTDLDAQSFAGRLDLDAQSFRRHQLFKVTRTKSVLGLSKRSNRFKGSKERFLFAHAPSDAFGRKNFISGVHGRRLLPPCTSLAAAGGRVKYI
ncbi:hypothetical protein M569_01090 [Genlisea aurea]|uniref:C2 NT-type domain-containing protein n=1 Tax=Genlisea aurea TaxID=192259 RepID=S8D1L2_9LAMI|nr:hypothetical protein M569_01090 [Genlisea aurea]